MGFLALKFRGFLFEVVQVKQRVVPAPLQCARYQAIGRINLLIPPLRERHLILGAFEPHLPLAQDGLIS